MGYGLITLGTYTNIGIQFLFVHLIIYTFSGVRVWSIINFLKLKNKKIVVLKEKAEKLSNYRDFSLIKNLNKENFEYIPNEVPEYLVAPFHL